MPACLKLPWEMTTGSGGAWSRFPTQALSMPEDIQKPSHHGPGHPSLGGLFSGGEIGPGDLMRSLRTWASWWSFLDSKRREGMLPVCESGAGRGVAEQRGMGHFQPPACSWRRCTQGMGDDTWCSQMRWRIFACNQNMGLGQLSSRNVFMWLGLVFWHPNDGCCATFHLFLCS